MRRREKFVITAVVLSLGVLGIQYVPIDWRYWAIAGFCLVSYLVSAWALHDDLQRHEWLTIVPFPPLYAASVSLFYFLLPESLVTKFAILGVFGIGMYALFLTANIFSVAKGRTIQLLHAAHAISLWFTLLTSLLFTNTIFSFRLPFFWNGLLVGLVHFPLIVMSLWSIELENRIAKSLVQLSGITTLLLVELAIILSFFPFSVWNTALFIMSVLYMALGILHNYLKGRLFDNTLREYSLVAVFTLIMFLVLFPYK